MEKSPHVLQAHGARPGRRHSILSDWYFMAYNENQPVHIHVSSETPRLQEHPSYTSWSATSKVFQSNIRVAGGLHWNRDRSLETTQVLRSLAWCSDRDDNPTLPVPTCHFGLSACSILGQPAPASLGQLPIIHLNITLGLTMRSPISLHYQRTQTLPVSGLCRLACHVGRR